MAKMSNSTLSLELDEIRRLRFVEHLTLGRIGERFGVSRQRIHQVVGNTSQKLLSTNRTANNSGSTTYKGVEAENYIAHILELNGVNCELQPNGAPFDILANEYRVNVKSCYAPKDGHGCINPIWRWNLYGRGNCDVFILVAVPANAIFVIPERNIPSVWSSIGFCHPTNSKISKQRWQKYQDRFDILATQETPNDSNPGTATN